ncbi:MAG: type I 3-dehydroquinate dehydratase, partial [Planctomycetota bacterium]
MICVTIGRARHQRMIEEMKHLGTQDVQLIELRLDYITRAVNLKRLTADKPCPLIATVRRREEGGRWTKSEGERLMLLRGAIASGAFDYVDLESDIADQIPRYGQTKRIVSFHLFEGTPDDLEGLHQAIAAEDADIIKIATMANSIDDCFRMMEVVKNAKVPTIGICMGEMGTMTRILSTRLGSPFTYASFSVEKKVAPGLIHWLKMRDLYRIDDISPQTELFGVIADPVAHSHSPIIHNGAFQAAGI